MKENFFKIFLLITLLFNIILLFFGQKIVAAKISCCQDLQNIQNSFNQSFLLQNDIDCTGFNFTSIFSGSVGFSGSLDGKGYLIYNLSINSTNSPSNYGLFASGSGAQVFDLSLVNVCVDSCAGVFNTGVLFGHCSNCNISNVHILSNGTFTNSVLGTNNLGGFVGCGSAVNIMNSTIQNTFFGKGITGGFIGTGTNCNFIRCFNLGVDPSLLLANSTLYAGGITGFCTSCKISESGEIRLFLQFLNILMFFLRGASRQIILYRDSGMHSRLSHQLRFGPSVLS